MEAKGTFLRIWLSHFANRLLGLSDMPPLRRAMNFAAAPFALRHVRHVTFEQLSSAGDEVRAFDDGTVPQKPEKVSGRPQPWKFQQRGITPK